MNTLPLDPLELYAIDPLRNIRRRWRVVAARDLFGRWRVETSWGRIGAAGRTLVRSFAEEAEARRYVVVLIGVRARALRRLGVPYLPAHGRKGGARERGAGDGDGGLLTPFC